MSIDAGMLSGNTRKNDALFAWGLSRQLPFVYTYCQGNTEIVHGPSCYVENEIDVQRCRQDGVPIYARRGGGGTVVLSQGMIVIVVVGHKTSSPGGIKDLFSSVHRPLISILASMGIDTVREQGISDLAIDGKKILGSSLYIPRKSEAFCYQSVLMVYSNPLLIPRYLKHPPREPDYRQGRSHEDFCTTLSREGCSMELPVLAREIARGLRSSL
jgi:lipoate-protein ligase A